MSGVVEVSELTAVPGVQPRQLIVTVYGLYARQSGGWLSVAALVRLLGVLGVDEPAVRSSISRLKRRGILLAQRQDGAAGYALSEQATEILLEGDERIFGRHRAELSDGWLLAVFSVPESERQKRHVLRSRLAALGLGTTSPGVWIAPAHLAEQVRHEVARLELDGYVDLFRADHLAFGELAEKVSDWWDLAALQESYREFLAARGPVLARWRRRRTTPGEEAFADYVLALTDWRRLPYLDPGLPAELLPAGWLGAEAAEVFFALRERLASAAQDYVGQLRLAAG
ncbi:phenylacetic acid degradation operon negative regulatory protein [Kutzneria viridogrisea]|uniref:Phenylacetic acid degradation operon negative regulatory protein n=1 Tax=Kutzneria viridogrisea TaxID=47990 RepID=A0ABR6BM40_9PSEU|nr:PaaX family transcriptional regulator C-terminal domain-containing protein [Kutzneria albida]MBA8927965.1 phenylacetic acid degradation operon negative regulatory protein [Kutzneria viridogrisea]